MTWTDENLEHYLRNTKLSQAFPVVSETLIDATQTRVRAFVPPSYYRIRRWAIASALVALVLSGNVVLGAAERLFHIQFKISELSLQEWLRDRVSDKQRLHALFADSVPPKRYSTTETKAMVSFPLRTPKWLPLGAKEVAPISGYFARVNGKPTHDIQHFSVSQRFDVHTDTGTKTLYIFQRVFPIPKNAMSAKVILPPTTVETKVAGYPAFISDQITIERTSDSSQFKATHHAENKSLQIMVEEGGQVTEITLSGLPVDLLQRIAESMF